MAAAAHAPRAILMTMDAAALARQALYAVAYYTGLVLMLRLAGKRLAGQTTTFDLVVLIQLAVVLQMTLLGKGVANAAVFFITVLALHRLVAQACARLPWLRKVLRGEPRPLITQGMVLEDALAEEGMSRAELLAGLRKLGFASPEEVELAVLEETGHISAVRLERPPT
jgi:uncharacterized membrane protein YcaP (DUF421 family)